VRLLPALAAALCLVSAPLAAADEDTAARPGAQQAETDFRVQPYLQNPSADSMLVTWFSWEDEPGQLKVDGKVHTSSPELQEHLDWTENNRRQADQHPEWGEWFREGRAYRHQVLVSGLEPDTDYSYTVAQGDSEQTHTFTTAPTSENWSDIRFTAMSDSETEPAGRVTRREWAPGALAEGSQRPSAEGSQWARTFGTQNLQGQRVLRYALTEDEGFARNMGIVEDRDPDLMLFAGDLVQGGGYQPGWDEWFRYLAGEVNDIASKRPVLTAMGNWEGYGASDGGYTIPAVIDGRTSYKSYFTPNPNGMPEHRGNYHRLDYGPVTFLTLDSTKGTPDDHRSNYPAEERLAGTEYTGPGTDTQSSFTTSDYVAGGGTDLSPYNEGSAQWHWVEAQLADARAEGQIVFVQFHHAPYSSGEHGLPMNHRSSSGQGGTPMRIYSEMFEEYGVAGVISGHSEMFERSYVDVDGDGHGINYYDVGVGGDGLRGERRRQGNLLSAPLLGYNPYKVWSADQSEPEVWKNERLVDGGKHYGHLEVDIRRGGPGGAYAAVTLTPVYAFPLLDGRLRVVGVERRTYDDRILLRVDRDGTIVDQRRIPRGRP
jgi:Calcineurin-like phosphoesterase/Purple acid Phosphatase, N-terminal domain